MALREKRCISQTAGARLHACGPSPPGLGPLLCTVRPDRPGGWVVKHVSRSRRSAIETSQTIFEARDLYTNTTAILCSAIWRGERSRPLTRRQVCRLPYLSGGCMEATPPRRVIEGTHWTPYISLTKQPGQSQYTTPSRCHCAFRFTPCLPTCGPLL